jgi:hypothetical protein
MEPTANKNWMISGSRICLWAWIIYAIAFIPLSLVLAPTYISYLSRVLAILLIFPIIEIFNPLGTERSYFVKMLLLSLLFLILGNISPIILLVIILMVHPIITHSPNFN